MYEILTYVIVCLSGAIMGLIGQLSEDGQITMRATVGICLLGGALSCICYTILISVFPEHYRIVWGISSFVGLTRWSTVIPVCNLLLRSAHSILYMINHKDIK